MVAFSARVWWITLLVVVLSRIVTGDFPCVCTYDLQTPIFAQPTDTARIIGNMTALECRPEIYGVSNDQWAAITYATQAGFISTRTGIEVHTCPGSPSSINNPVTTTQAPVTTTATTGASSTTSTTTASASTPLRPVTAATTSSVITTASTSAADTLSTSTSTSGTHSTPLTGQTTITPVQTTTTNANVTTGPYVTYGCSQKYVDLARNENGILFTFQDTCYEIVPEHTIWRYAEHDCVRKGGHLAHISSSSEQNAIYEVVEKMNHNSVWIGLNDRYHEERFEWTSGDPVVYTNWYRYRKDYYKSEDCVVISLAYPRHGQWEDVPCNYHYGYVCEFGTEALTQSPLTVKPDFNSEGNIHLCPQNILDSAHFLGHHLAQYGTSCYQLGNDKHSYFEAEHLCNTGNGHLADITSADEQTFIQAFTYRYKPQAFIWIGLCDLASNGNFAWTSGVPVTYTNWGPGHGDSAQNQYPEECTVFLPFRGGQWGDTACRDGPWYSDVNMHIALCEYRISGHSSPSGPTLHNGAVLVG